MNYQLVMQMMCISCEGFAGAMPMVFKPGQATGTSVLFKP